MVAARKYYKVNESTLLMIRNKSGWDGVQKTSRAIGIDARTLKKVFDRHHVDKPVIRKLSKYLDITFEDIIGDDDGKYTGNNHNRQQQYKNYDFVLGRKTGLSNIQSQVGSSRSSFVNSIAKRISYYDNQIFLKCAKLKTILRFKDSCIAEFADLDYGIDWNKKVFDFVNKFEKKTWTILEQNESTNLDEAFTFRTFLMIKEFFHLLIENGLFRLYIIHLVAEKKSNQEYWAWRSHYEDMLTKQEQSK